MQTMNDKHSCRNNLYDMHEDSQLCTFNRLHYFTKEASAGLTRNNEVSIDAIFVPTSRYQSIFIDLLSQYADLAQHIWIMPTQNAIQAFCNQAILPANVSLIPADLVEEEHRALLCRASSSNPSVRIADNYDLPSIEKRDR